MTQIPGDSVSQGPNRLPRTPLYSLFGAVVRPIQSFMRLEASSGILLLAAAVLAIAWANSPFAASYEAVFGLPLTVGAGAATAQFNLSLLINDGLMAIFFFVVGMEIKRELAVGELRTFSQAVLPGIAAVGGMAIPALVFLAFNYGQPSARGWGIPMATDIAFCIGCMTLLKKRVPHGLIVFVTALAIFDDIGGILVIAIFYGHGMVLSWLLASGVLSLILVAVGRAGVRNGLVYLLLGAALWFAVHASGIHATIAGVIVGLCIPAHSKRDSRAVLEDLHDHTAELLRRPRDQTLDEVELLMIEEKIEDLEPPLNRFVHLWHPYVAFFIMPVFALANSGVSLHGMTLDDLLEPTALGIALGLFVGKQLGIFTSSWLAIRAGLSPAPGGASGAKLYGASVLAGIGFTVALFIATLAYAGSPELLAQAKLGILLGSLLSGVVGCVALLATRALPDSAVPAESA